MIVFWTAVVTSLMTLAGVIITCAVTLKKTSNEFIQKLEISQAVTDTKIENLTIEVHKHNDYAERVPAVETNVINIDNRVCRLENKIM